MPVYEYVCKQCGEKFTLTMSISEHDRRDARCPKCQGMDLDQLLPTIYVKTSKKS